MRLPELLGGVLSLLACLLGLLSQLALDGGVFPGRGCACDELAHCKELDDVIGGPLQRQFGSCLYVRSATVVKLGDLDTVVCLPSGVLARLSRNF